MRPWVDISRVQQAYSLSSVVSRYLRLSRRGSEQVGRCPFHHDRNPSLHVNDLKGVFHCFGCGASGDVISFVQRIENVGFREAVELIEQGCFAPVAAPRRDPSLAPVSETVAVAQAIWREAGEIEDTEGETYLLNRGLSRGVPPVISELRHHHLSYPGLEGKHAALIAAARGADGEVSGIQRIFLTSDGRKLPIQKPKLSLGRIKGSAIRLGPPAAEIAVCEGLEDGLAIRCELPDQSVWVSAGANMIGSMWLPPTCESVIIAADNDNAGTASAQEAAIAFQRQGRRVRVVRPAFPHKDFNDQLRATAP